MKYTVYDRLLRREIGDRKRYASIRGIYGDRKWIQDMDIVNELEGHTGCVNALSWSRSGRLLASGSDDHRINIHVYHPESSTSQFNLTTSIVTGHRSNIFSVKFMPYSNDRTIVSATDDVRIFDIEHSGRSMYGSSATPGHRNAHRTIDAATLTEGDTNAKSFRCHSDTVKRIVTEDNPFYFLTCSEDGDVRQWDIRQPAKTYPPSRTMPRWASPHDATDNIPPPLISYSRYNLDLNTVSCSPSQPHYIALGGAHLHCFLHDRRMLGRDKLHERGEKLSSPQNWSDSENVSFGKATQCVKKFAPNGQQRMGRGESGHITACKISDANPNEMVVSWSGDWIYSFDLQQSPDAGDDSNSTHSSVGGSSRRVREKKRKRTKSGLSNQEEIARTGSRQRTESSQVSASDIPANLALRVNYENGQSEEIRIVPPRISSIETEEATLSNTDHFRVAKTVVKIQHLLFRLDPTKVTATKRFGPNFTSALGFASSILPDMEDISRAWAYPINPTEVQVAVQNKLRSGREVSQRFVQAAGTLARVLGGELHTGGNASGTISTYFTTIGQSISNTRPLSRREHFVYDFLKAILLWLDSGLGALVEGFSSAGAHPRLPLPLDADIESIDGILIPYLLHLAGDDPIMDLDANRFEGDESRLLYPSAKDAVVAFSQALQVPFADLTGDPVSALGSSSEIDSSQDRRTAMTKWAFKFSRGLLWTIAKDIHFESVDRSFGGRGIAPAQIKADERILREQQDDVDPLTEDEAVNAEVVERARTEDSNISPPHSMSSQIESDDADNEDTFLLATASSSEEIDEDDNSDGDIDPLEYDDDDDENDSDSDDGAVDEHGLSRTPSGRVLWRSDFDRSRLRERVEAEVPCSTHSRTYRGHCNVKTTKDVNFLGLQDEYVVSGSDSGHVFIWDRKTSQLINILEGDGEIVNVVQGHPYEPTLAVSGIDHTIKIFSPDAQEQWNARKGIGVRSTDPGLSSLSFGRRRRPRASPSIPPPSTEPPETSDEEDRRVTSHGLRSRKCMQDEYEITSRNDMDRKGGRNEAFITRALLAELAQRIHAQQHGMGDDDVGEDTIVLNNDDGCNIM